MSSDARIQKGFSLAVAEGSKYETLYVRVVGGEAPQQSHELPPEEVRDRAVAGCVDAQIGWGHRLLEGHGVEPDPAAALLWFERAARSGDAEALNMVGRCYERGWGVAQDFAEAARWFRQAAGKDHAWAAFNLGCLLAEGRGVPLDIASALTLFVRAARRGNAKAMNMLGCWRASAQASQGDAAKKARSAALWFRWAAEGGCVRGQFHYGCHLVTAGRIDDGLRWLRTSYAHAPEPYRLEVVEALSHHPLPVLREITREILSGE